MLNFIFVRHYGITTCRTSNLARIWNFVQMRAIATKLWAVNGIQNADAAILNLLFLSILVTRSTSGSRRRHYCKISLIYVNRRLSYCSLCKNPRWRPPPSGFYFCSILWHACMEELKRNAIAKFRANICNSEWVMNDRWKSKWRPPPSWIYYFCPFWSNGLFPVAAVCITEKFH